jgi:hypothetical protein
LQGGNERHTNILKQLVLRFGQSQNLVQFTKCQADLVNE